jgi:hypothetical protein
MDWLLKERQMTVELPRLGQVVEPKVKARALLKTLAARGMGAGRELTGEALWEALISRDLGDGVLSAPHIAAFWFEEEPTTSDLAAIESVLANDPVRFSQDCREPSCYRIHTPRRAADMQGQEEWLDRLGPVEGRLVLLRSADGYPVLAVVTGVEGFQIRGVSSRTPALICQPTRVTVVGEPWPEALPSDDDAADLLMQRLASEELILGREAEAVLSVPEVARLIDGSPRSLEAIASLLDKPLQGTRDRLRLAFRLIEFRAVPGPEGFVIRPRTGRKEEEEEEGEPLDHNRAASLIEALFPTDVGLRKVSADQAQHTIALRVDFPDVVSERYAALVERASALTGWKVLVHPSVNQQAVTTAARRLLPGLKESVAIHLDRRIVEVEIDPLPENWIGAQEVFARFTGFRLAVRGDRSAGPPSEELSQPPAGSIRLEINEAYRTIKGRLEPLGLYRAGLKGGTIVLTFITPEVGERQRRLIGELAAEVGYPLAIYPHPNQNSLARIADELCARAGLALRKAPSIVISERLVHIQPVGELSSDMLRTLQEAYMERTGYRLAVPG